MQESIETTQELQLVVFQIGKEEFGVNINQVREIIKLTPITPIPRVSPYIEGVINLRGQILAIVDLAKKLDLKKTIYSEKTKIIIIELEETKVGIIVNEVTEVLRFSTKDIELPSGLIMNKEIQPYIKGVGKLGDRLLVIIDLAAIFSSTEMQEINKNINEKKNEE
ncbi:MAG: purine-binding chemotaxis protein CheW [Gammaproteobacteria bacterium]|nr:purine-binding chemotaxis protein CheW [Gammaproteobacteria bacterium]